MSMIDDSDEDWTFAFLNITLKAALRVIFKMQCS